MFMVGAMYFWIIIQVSGYVILHRLICISAYTAKQPDSGCCQSRLGAATDATADQHLNTCICQK